MIILTFPLLILGVLCLTRIWYGDWKTALACAVVAMVCLYFIWRDSSCVPARQRSLEARRIRAQQTQEQGRKQEGASNKMESSV